MEMVIYSYFSHFTLGCGSWHQMDRRLAKTQSWYECGGKSKSNYYHLARNYLLLSELLQLILNKILHSVKVCCTFLPTHTFTHKVTLANNKTHTSYTHPSTVHLHNPFSNEAIFLFPSQSSK